MKKILVTGCAGFIGSNLTDKLLSLGFAVVGIDNFNDYYDPEVKERNIQGALKNKNFKLYRVDILAFKKLSGVISKEKPEIIIHLAARAGVRPSLADPLLYTNVNVLGTVNLLKLSIENNVEKFIFGSSSSVYGDSKNVPFEEDDLCQDIISPYGASKRAAEFFVESFNKCFGLETIVLRFFTVYGERGRTDMAPALFANSVLNDTPITRFGDGDSMRDYTYVGDIVVGITEAISHEINFEVINLGNNNPVGLNDFISEIETICDKKATVVKAESQTGDAKKTWASINRAKKSLTWEPKIKLREGLGRYVKWLQSN